MGFGCFDSGVQAEAMSFFEDGLFLEGFWHILQGVKMKSPSFILIAILSAISLALWFSRGRIASSRNKPSPKEPPKSPDAVPFKKLRIGTYQEFVGRGDEMAWLATKLIDEPTLHVVITSVHGAGGMGKTFLAHKFALDHKTKELLFAEIYLGESSALDAGLAHLRDRGIDTSQIRGQEDFKQWFTLAFAQGQGVLILDDVRPGHDISLLATGNRNWRALITTRSEKLGRELAGEDNTRAIDVLSPDECLDLYGKILGRETIETQEQDFRDLAEAIGRRPYGVRLSAQSMGQTGRPAGEYLALIQEKGVGEQGLRVLLQDCLDQLAAVSSFARELLDDLAVCADPGMELEFFCLWHENEASAEQVEHELSKAQDLGLLLVESIEAKEPASKNLRLHTDLLALIRGSAGTSKIDSLIKFIKQTLVAPKEFPEPYRPLQSQITDLANRVGRSKQLAFRLYDSFFEHLYRTGALQWAYDLGQTTLEHCSPEDSPVRYAQAIGNQALILKAWGRLEDAMALLKKQEEICEKLGDQAGLSRSYGNQGLILQDWGRLEEAMDLHKKEEKICEKLGDQAGMAACYGNQALILKAWGRLEDAMALLKKQEEICEKLGDQAGMAACYGNQALILKAWGRLEDAIDMHNKEEMICEKLGDQAGLSRSYGNQAVILKAWGRLDEAMELHKKEEKIKKKLGDQAGLVNCHWNTGLLYRKMNQHEQAKKHFLKSLEIQEQLQHPDLEKNRKYVEDYLKELENTPPEKE